LNLNFKPVPLLRFADLEADLAYKNMDSKDEKIEFLIKYFERLQNGSSVACKNADQAYKFNNLDGINSHQKLMNNRSEMSPMELERKAAQMLFPFIREKIKKAPTKDSLFHPFVEQGIKRKENQEKKESLYLQKKRARSKDFPVKNQNASIFTKKKNSISSNCIHQFFRKGIKRKNHKIQRDVNNKKSKKSK